MKGMTKSNSTGETINIKNHTTGTLESIVSAAPLGTNLGLYHFLWMLLRGEFLVSRGAVFPALQSLGLETDEVRRSWTAMRYRS